MMDAATRLLQILEADQTEWKYPWMKQLCKLTAEYMTLDGLQDAKRASDITNEIIDIVDNID